MTVYFKKINLDKLPLHEDFNSIKGDLEFSHGMIKYFNINDSNYYNLLKDYFKIPPRRIFLVEGHISLLPHRDKDQLSCINYYIDTRGYTTNFWIPNSNLIEIRIGPRYDRVTGITSDVELGYNYVDLTLIDSFLAKNGESYVLNINEVHSVENPSSAEIRLFIQFQWDTNTTVDELIRNLEI